VGLRLAFSPDGQTLALAAGGPAVRLVDAATGKERLADTGPATCVELLDVAPDGRTALTAEEGEIRLWDAASGRERRRLGWGPGTLSDARFVDGGRTVLGAGWDDARRASVQRTWELATGKEVSRMLRRGKESMTDSLLALSPDGRTAAWSTAGDPLTLVEVATGRELRSLTVPDSLLMGGAFLPDSRTLVTWGWDNVVRRWDIATGQERGHFVCGDRGDDPPGAGQPADMIHRAAVSPDGRLMAVSGMTRVLVLHDLSTGEQVCRRKMLPVLVRVLAFSPDGRTLAWGDARSRDVHLVETATLGERGVLAGHLGGIASLAFTADGRTLLSGSEDATVLVWDLTRTAAGDGGRGESPSAAELEARWKDLSGDDAARAYAAVRRLAAAPAGAVPFLAARLRPAPAADEQQLSRLIAALDGDAFAARDKAARELAALGERATAALRKALAGAHSAEARRALQALLDRQARAERAPSVERIRTLRAVEALEYAATPDARQLLADLAAGAPAARQTAEAKAALDRLTRRAASGP
jgi:WD40 repeat protein